MHTTVIVALLPLLVAAGGNDGQIPKRADALAHLSDAEAFEVLSTLGSDVLVGVKRADQPRGMWAGKRLLSVDDERTAIDAVTLAVGANRVLKRSAHSSLPLMRILLDSPEVLTTLRASPHVEYVESASFRVQYASSGNTSGCEDDPYGSLAGAVSNPPNSEGDTEPWNFQHHVIADASMRGYGGGEARRLPLSTPEPFPLRPNSGLRRQSSVDAMMRPLAAARMSASKQQFLRSSTRAQAMRSALTAHVSPRRSRPRATALTCAESPGCRTSSNCARSATPSLMIMR